MEGSQKTYYQIGIFTWGYGCSIQGNPGVYARVTSALDFIKDNMQGEQCPPA